jgi:hypothetical protein
LIRNQARFGRLRGCGLRAVYRFALFINGVKVTCACFANLDQTARGHDHAVGSESDVPRLPKPSGRIKDSDPLSKRVRDGDAAITKNVEPVRSLGQFIRRSS